MKWLIYGGNGWIGTQFCNLLKNMDSQEIIYGKSRADKEIEVENEIKHHNPDRIVSFIGRTYGPGYSTIDYLETPGKLVDNIQDNLYAPLILSILAKKYNIHFTYLGTGCIFNGYDGNTGTGYDESAQPDFFGSSYSIVKGFTDRLMHMFEDTTLNARIRMPASDENNPRNFIIKLMNYKKICSIDNSISILPELLPVLLQMIINKETGTINLTNPGLINHNQILNLVKEIIDPNLQWENFTIQQQSEILLGGRSNNLLNTDKLVQKYNVRHVQDAIRDTIIKLGENIKKSKNVNI